MSLSHIGCLHISLSHVRENTMKMYKHIVFGNRNITPLRFAIIPAVEFCILAISPILPYHQVLVRHTHPQLT
jgi:hypothetical protein